MYSEAPRIARHGKQLLLLTAVMLTPNCYHYSPLNTKSDPATEYEKKVMWSCCWGLFNTKFAYSLLTIVTR